MTTISNFKAKNLVNSSQTTFATPNSLNTPVDTQRSRTNVSVGSPLYPQSQFILSSQLENTKFIKKKKSNTTLIPKDEFLNKMKKKQNQRSFVDTLQDLDNLQVEQSEYKKIQFSSPLLQITKSPQKQNQYFPYGIGQNPEFSDGLFKKHISHFISPRTSKTKIDFSSTHEKKSNSIREIKFPGAIRQETQHKDRKIDILLKIEKIRRFTEKNSDKENSKNFDMKLGDMVLDVLEKLKDLDNYYGEEMNYFFGILTKMIYCEDEKLINFVRQNLKGSMYSSVPFKTCSYMCYEQFQQQQFKINEIIKESEKAVEDQYEQIKQLEAKINILKVENEKSIDKLKFQHEKEVMEKNNEIQYKNILFTVNDTKEKSLKSDIINVKEKLLKKKNKCKIYKKEVEQLKQSLSSQEKLLNMKDQKYKECQIKSEEKAKYLQQQLNFKEQQIKGIELEKLLISKEKEHLIQKQDEAKQHEDDQMMKSMQFTKQQRMSPTRKGRRKSSVKILSNISLSARKGSISQKSPSNSPTLKSHLYPVSESKLGNKL